MQPFVTASLIQLLCRVTKFGWSDDERFHDVVKESTNFLSQGLSEHYAIGLEILNQLVFEMNQPNPGLPSTHHRRVAYSFRDQSLFQIFQISSTSLRHMKTDVASRLQEVWYYSDSIILETSLDAPLSKEALECLVRLASVRRSLFANDAARSMFWPI